VSKVNPAFEIDVGPSAGHMAVRSRSGGNTRAGKIPHAFPELLDGIDVSKSMDRKPNQVADIVHENMDHQVDATRKAIRQKLATKDVIAEPEGGDVESVEKPRCPDHVAKCLQNLAAVEKIAEPENASAEKAVMPITPDAAARYLQNLIATPQTQEHSSELAAPVEKTTTVLSTLIAKINAGTPALAEKAEGEIPVPSKQDGPFTAVVQLRAKRDAGEPGLDSESNSVAPVPDVHAAVEVLSPGHEEGPHLEPHKVEVRVLKVETSFAPAASMSLVTQFSKAVVDGLQGAGQSNPAIIGNVVLDPRRDVVKSIQLRLHPEDLGEIKVAMHLRGDELRLKVEVSSPRVEAILLKDHQVLKDLIGKAGYDVSDSSIAITHGPEPLAAPQRDIVAANPAQDPSVGQGFRQHPGAGEENRNLFQNMRGSHAVHPEFDGEENAKTRQVELPGRGRGGGIYL
jgi:flagellar hook-length control protein FliK